MVRTMVRTRPHVLRDEESKNFSEDSAVPVISLPDISWILLIQ